MKRNRFLILLSIVLVVSLVCVFVACNDGDDTPQTVEFTVTFDSQGGSEVQPIKVVEGGAITLPDAPTKTCAIFDGWYLDAETVNAFVETNAITSDITLHAKWRDNHTVVTDVAVPADCTNSGLTEGSHCSVCGTTIVAQQTVDALGHNTDGTIAHKDANCTEDGVVGGTYCTRCNNGKSDAETIIPAGHNYNEVGICSKCEEYQESFITYTEGLTFSYDADDACYEVTGYTGSEAEVVIPYYYNDGTNGYHCVTAIGKEAMDSNTTITSVTIPNSVKSIGQKAFDECKNLTSVTIGNGVTSIGRSAFYNCTGLVSITIPNSVKSIGEYAFYGCEKLTSVTIGSGVTTIGEGAFRLCDSLTSVIIPNSVNSIGAGAFFYCEKLTSVTIGSGVTTIGDEAFCYCMSLTSITIPDSVKSIGKDAFAICDNLTTINYNGTKAEWDEVEKGSYWIGDFSGEASSSYRIICTDGIINA